MKSADFLIDKAKEYINSIDKISPNLVSKYSGGFDGSPELTEQENKLSDLYLKVRLLFSEVANGDIFFSQLKPIYEDHLLSLKHKGEEEKLAKTKHTLELFIEHINDFKS